MQGSKMNFKKWSEKYYPNEDEETLHKMSHAWASGHVNMSYARWTNVKDRLPEKPGLYLTFGENEFDFDFLTKDSFPHGVTHWCLLPDPPGGKE